MKIFFNFNLEHLLLVEKKYVLLLPDGREEGPLPVHAAPTFTSQEWKIVNLDKD